MQMGLTILLVDDDQMLTEKTKNSLDWDSLGISMVFTAGNIHEAKGILKVFKVDILLCDVDMPMGSGLELVEWIRNSQMEMKCIFLSSYANFTYAQKALRLGSDNYLLKPISKKELEAELKEITQELLREQTYFDMQAKKEREEAWKDVLVQTLADDTEDKKTKPIYSAVEPVTLVLVGLLDNSEERINIKELSLYNYAVRTAAEKYLFDVRLDVIVSYKDTEWLIVLKKLTDDVALGMRLEKLQQDLNAQTGHRYCFYIAAGRPYGEAAKMIRQLSVMREYAIPNRSLMIWESTWSFRKTPYPQPDWSEWQKQMQSEADFQSVAEEMIAFVTNACESGRWYLADLKKFVQKHGDLLYTFVGEKHISFGDLFDLQEYSRMNYLARRSEEGCIDLIQTVWTKIERLNPTQQKSGTVISRLKAYIDENLGTELTRAVLAGQVYLSEDYVTRLFIKETGMTLPNYIAAKRMEKAARLLLETKYPISRVAMEVGYSNFSYFSKTFRDYAGCTPNEYRAKYNNAK